MVGKSSESREEASKLFILGFGGSADFGFGVGTAVRTGEAFVVVVTTLVLEGKEFDDFELEVVEEAGTVLRVREDEAFAFVVEGVAFVFDAV